MFFLLLFLFGASQLWSEKTLDPTLESRGKKISPSPLSIQVFSGDEKFGSLANSVLVIGEKNILLIDAQRSVNNARLLAEVIRKTGKKLETIYITHMHPDHFLGIPVLQTAFPGVKVVACGLVANEMKNGAETLRKMVKSAMASEITDQIPDSVVLPEGLKVPTLFLEGNKLEILACGPGESQFSSMVFVPSLKALIAGDMLFNKVFLWLNEKRFEGWLENLKKLRRMKNIEVIYPGHGDKTDPSVIDENIRYIEEYQRIVQTSRNAEEAIEAMKKLYTDYRMERFLTYGLKNFFPLGK
ncbi:MAG: MBL fold metallo-hydrolase [Candidatus Ozemobacteraceae bacterium]